MKGILTRLLILSLTLMTALPVKAAATPATSISRNTSSLHTVQPPDIALSFYTHSINNTADLQTTDAPVNNVNQALFEITLPDLRKTAGGFSSTYVITNTGDALATTAHTFYNQQGDLVASLDSAPIAPGAHGTYALATVGTLPDGYTGYAIVASDQPITGVVLPPPTYTLTVDTTGYGSVTLDPPDGVYEADTVVTLTAAAHIGWTFDGWSGDLNGNTNPVTLTMTTHKVITATFIEEVSPYLITLSGLRKEVGGFSSVYVITNTGDALATTAHAFYNQQGDLVASLDSAPIAPGAHGTYALATIDTVPDGYTGYVIVTSDQPITGVVLPPPPPTYTLTVDTIGYGSVTLNPPGGVYEENTVVTLTAAANTGWTFSGWSGDAAGTLPQTTVIMNGEKSITATFSLQVEVTPETGGTLVYSDTHNAPLVIIQAPAGAVSETITLAYTPQKYIETPPEGFAFAGRSFDLSAHIDGEPLAGFTFTVPITITLYYSDTDIIGLDEDSLTLYAWREGAWEDAACGTYTRDAGANWLSVPLCHLSQFALFAQPRARHTIFLPAVLRDF